MPFDIGGKDRDAGVGKSFRQYLQGYGLACSGCPGHQAVPVSERERQDLTLLARSTDEDRLVVNVCQFLGPLALFKFFWLCHCSCSNSNRLYATTATLSSHRDPRRNAWKKSNIGPAVADWCKFATLGDNLSNGSHYVFSEPFPTVMLRVGRNGRIRGA